MKRELTKRLGIQMPADGYTPEERIIIDLAGNNVVEGIYAKLPTNRMKAIVAMHFELGYDQETIGNIFQVKQEQVSQEIRNIKRVLSGLPYRPHKRRKTTIALEDLMTMCMTMTQP